MSSTFNRNPPVHSGHPSLNPGLDRIQTASIRSSRRHVSTARVMRRASRPREQSLLALDVEEELCFERS